MAIDKAIMYDMSKCTGCRGCQVACMQWNQLPAEKTINHGTYQNPPDLDGTTWNLIEFKELNDEEGFRWTFFSHRCMHCTDASCLYVCPTGASNDHRTGLSLLIRPSVSDVKTVSWPAITIFQRSIKIQEQR